MRCSLLLGLALAWASLSAAADGKLMHCFYFTAAQGALEADWQGFFPATDELPGTIAGLRSVWYGKLRRPLRLLTTYRETMQNLRDPSAETTGPVHVIERQWGVCMGVDDENALKVYADHSVHKQWEQVYCKVRQPGTTTLGIVAVK